MRNLISLCFALIIHCFARVFYKFDITYINQSTDTDNFWGKPKILLFLNHTSLFEPIFLGAMPTNFFFNNVSRVLIPGADITIDRPIVGRFYKSLFPQLISITRKRDRSWQYFLNEINSDKMIAIAPEGRMMRDDGLDKHGKPMTIKSGIADILEIIDDGEMIIIYSGGLHHVQKPGQPYFKIFKTIKANIEKINIAQMKKEIQEVTDKKSFHRKVVDYLEEKKKKGTPIN